MSAAAMRGILRPAWAAQVDEYAVGLQWSVAADRLFAADAAGGVHAFAADTGERCWTAAERHEGGVMALARHPRQALLASAGQDGCVRLRDSVTGAVCRTLSTDAAWVEHLAWSPGGEWLAAAAGRNLYVWSDAGELGWKSEIHPSTVSAVAWAGPGEIVSACYGRVSFWQAASGTPTSTLAWQGSLVSLVLSPDGSIVACGSQDNSVHFWRRKTGRDSQMSGYAGKPVALAFDASGKLLATSGGEDVTVWSFAGKGPEGTRPGILALHTATVRALQFSHRNRRLASGCRDGGVVVWNVERNGRGKPVGAAAVSGVVESVSWRQDDRALAVADGQGGVTLWTLNE